MQQGNRSDTVMLGPGRSVSASATSGCFSRRTTGVSESRRVGLIESRRCDTASSISPHVESDPRPRGVQRAVGTERTEGAMVARPCVTALASRGRDHRRRRAGVLLRRPVPPAPGTEPTTSVEQSTPGIADSLTEHRDGGDAMMLGQAASDAAFDRTVDMVTIMATDPDLRTKMHARIEPLVDAETA